MLATVAAAGSAKVQKKSTVFLYRQAEPHAMYAIYKQTRTLCVLQYYSVHVYTNLCQAVVVPALHYLKLPHRHGGYIPH